MNTTMFPRIGRLTAAFVITGLLAAAPAGADPISLIGEGASGGAPLAASVDFHVTDDTLRMTVTNTADQAGPNNRITYIGMQLPTAGLDMTFTGGDGTAWTLQRNGRLPGAGANRFNWLLSTTRGRANAGGGDSVGLNLEESITFDITSSATPVADLVRWSDWAATEKDGYRLAAKFQSVGIDGEDSGVAHHIVTTGSSNAAIPEPATLALMALGGVMVLHRRKR